MNREILCQNPRRGNLMSDYFINSIFGYFGFFFKQGNSMSDANYYVLVWHLTWNSPNHYFGSFWHFLWREISWQMPACYMIAGIWHENSPLKVRACVSAASQFWIFWKWGIYCQIPADKYKRPLHIDHLTLLHQRR